MIRPSSLLGPTPPDIMGVMEKRPSPKNRKSVKQSQPIDREKGASAARETGTGRFLLPSNTPLKDVLLRLRKVGDYIIVANPSRMDDQVIDDISIETVPGKPRHTGKMPWRTVLSI